MKLGILIYNYVCLAVISAEFLPTWTSLDTRPLPAWYDSAKIGIFIHWGVFSVPSFHSEWFWHGWKISKYRDIVKFMEKNYKPSFAYQEFAKDFTAEFFDPDEWADLFQKSGARYVVLTSKHHEGFTLWPSKYSFGWTSKDIGPNRDLIQDLAGAVRRKQLHFGLYHSLYEWFNPLYLADKENNWTTSTFVDNKIIPELHELVNKYFPEVIWSDGDWEAPDYYWKSTQFLAWLFNDSPVKDVVVTNDRWGQGLNCKHGSFYSCEDRFNPGYLLEHKWENAMTLDRKSWGFRRNLKLSDILSIQELIKILTETISCGGNILINVGPTKYGTIAPIFQERLLQLGQWLAINGEAIYDSSPWKIQNDTITRGVWYTQKNNSVYAIFLKWPKTNILTLSPGNTPFSELTILGNEKEKLKWETHENGVVQVYLPSKSLLVSQWSWVLKFN